MTNLTPNLPPGFRFHPTDEELIIHYLMNQAASLPCPVPIIAEVDIYKCDPWDLPSKALFGEREWYFFSPRDRKYPNGVRPNRAAASGYWKATGTDKMIFASLRNENVGVKKALVFYKGKPPKGIKTDWIMHEYRLTETRHNSSNKTMRHTGSSMRLDDWVLCRIYKKSNHHQFVDQEQEGSTVEDTILPSSPKPNPLSLTKSCSLTDLLNIIDCSALSQLLDGSLGLPELSQPSLNYPNPCQPLNYNSVTSYSSNGYNYLCQDAYKADTSVLLHDQNNDMKRKRAMDASSDDSDNFSRVTKKPSDPRSSTATNYCNQFESFQFSLLNQPFSTQQLLLNTHLEMQ